ncbi:MAG: GFA family protein [Myxococcota bacterium]|nr:GFA family protein [Deltaproteobacteria bacterium]MDQ3337362.1 GFA family protein [Myxococcota bacterium]
MTSAVGACLCGETRFEITLPTKWVAHCHCSMCRRGHGAPFVTWVGVLREQFRIVDGAYLRRYESSPGARRSFCAKCGSPLFFESERWPGEVHIARALFPGELDRAPQMHAFFSDRADWLVLHDDLPKRGGTTGTEPL